MPCWRMRRASATPSFGDLLLQRGRRIPPGRAAWRITPSPCEHQRSAARIAPRSGTRLSSTWRGPSSSSTFADHSGRPGRAAPSAAKIWPAHGRMLVVPMLKEDELIGAIVYLPSGGSPVHRQADRAGAELRRPGRHRHREHAAAQRAAPAHRRSHRIAGAADRDRARCSRSSARSPTDLQPVLRCDRAKRGEAVRGDMRFASRSGDGDVVHVAAADVRPTRTRQVDRGRHPLPLDRTSSIGGRAMLERSDDPRCRRRGRRGATRLRVAAKSRG